VSSSHIERPGAHPATDPAREPKASGRPAKPDAEAAAEDSAGKQVLMPQMGVSVAEGTIVEWRKRPGDWVEADEPVCDVTTDKVDVEIPSPAGGRLVRILVEPGATVPVGTPLAEIDAAARPGEAHPEERLKGGGANGEADRSGFHSPVVRRIAAKHRVDLSRVPGTGIGGRVRKRDLLAYIESGEGTAAETSLEPVLHMESPYQPEQAEAPAPRSVEELAPGRREPMSPMRQAIARHMVESRRRAAHCTTIVEADLSRVTARRRELREQMRRRGVNLTYLAFVALATVDALQEHPKLNASVDGSEIVYHDDVNLGIAVALEDGLIVPVIRRAQRLSLEGMAAAVADLAERARKKRLEPDDVHGGTFTITNPGQFGAVLATPIINQPQVAILDLEAIVKRPIVIEGPEGDSIAIRPMTYLCMSWDHRALDGVDAARFLGSVKDRLESWEVSG
jgi:2-oxoglutarate dehydrogenase E2 component (dihydrolipoamide succinyltransferase)